MDSYKTLCKPKLSFLLELLKMDLVYTSASGNYLNTASGKKVLDCVGGYGSTIMGHNPGILVDELKVALENKRPVHAQGSISESTGKLAKIINDLVKRDLGADCEWIVHLSNTGTEVTECALKHALMEWQERKSNLQQNGEPLFIALKGGFHGKTAGSLAVTYGSKIYNYPVNCIFINPGSSFQKIDDLFSNNTNEFGFCLIAGVIIEVIQGEGGVKPLEHDFVRHLHNACDKFGVMLIVDEVQSGTFRTGNFLATKEYNIVPDCITLGKALGGGMVKIAAMLVNRNRYCEDFSIVQTSTFAEDDVSSLIACRTLEYLSCYDVHKASSRFCQTVFAGLRTIRERYPGVIKEFRGRGFIIGVQFEEIINNNTSVFMKCLINSGLYAMFISSYILNRHNVRTAATLGNSNTLRIEPPIIITEADINKLLLALEDVTSLLYAGHFLAISAHIWIRESKYLHSTVCSFVPDLEPCLDGVNQVAFLTHIIDKTTLKSIDPIFGNLDDDDIEYFSAKLAPLVKGYAYHRQTIYDSCGKKIQLTLWGVPVDSRFFERSLRTGSPDAYKIVRQMAISAKESGATHLGLGQFTSIVTNSGTLLSDIGMPITTGNSLTVGCSFMSLKNCINSKQNTITDNVTMSRISVLKRHLSHLRIGIVGAAGNIGTVMALLAADVASSLLIIHREGVHSSNKFSKLLRALSLQFPEKEITADDKLDLLHKCDAIIVCVNSTGTMISAEHIKHGAIVLDISVPSVVESSVTSRKDITVLYGGTMKLPLGQKLNYSGFDKFNNEVFACMAETIITGLIDEKSSFSIGPIEKAKVTKSIELANQLGFKLGRSSYMGNR